MHMIQSSMIHSTDPNRAIAGAFAGLPWAGKTCGSSTYRCWGSSGLAAGKSLFSIDKSRCPDGFRLKQSKTVIHSYPVNEVHDIYIIFIFILVRCRLDPVECPSRMRWMKWSLLERGKLCALDALIFEIRLEPGRTVGYVWYAWIFQICMGGLHGVQAPTIADSEERCCEQWGWDSTPRCHQRRTQGAEDEIDADAPRIFLLYYTEAPDSYIL